MSKLKNTLFFLSLVFCVFSSHAASSFKIAAVVDKHIITTKDLDDRTRLYLLNIPQTPSEEEIALLKRRLLKQMIDEQLQLEETRLYGINAEEEEVNRQIQHIEKANNLKSGELLKKLDDNNIPHDTLLNQFRAGLAWQKLISYLTSSSEFSDQAIKQQAALKQNKDKTRYLLAEIAIPYTSYFDAMEAENKAHEIISLLKSGNSFGQLAHQLSQNPSAIRGGDIDWVDEDQLAPELREQIKVTPVGAVTQPIKHDGNVYVILVRGKQSPDTARQKLSVRQIEVTFPLLMTPEKKEEEIQRLEEIMKNVKTCAAFEKAAETIDGATLQYHQNINPEQLSGGLDKVISKLEIGEVSSASLIQDRSVVFFMVCEKHKIDQKQDLNEKKKIIKDKLGQKKFSELSTKRLIDVRRRAFIDVRL